MNVPHDALFIPTLFYKSEGDIVIASIRQSVRPLLPEQRCEYTVSHFSYAPPFQGPHLLTIMLESNILYDILLIYILSV